MLGFFKKRSRSGEAADKAGPLPDQEWLWENVMKVGNKVGLIVRRGYAISSIDARNTVIRELRPGVEVVLDQTMPPLSSANIGKPVELTFLVRYFDRPDGRWLRVGYETHLKDVVGGITPRDLKEDSFLLVGLPQRISPVNLRVARRRDAREADLVLSRAWDGVRLKLVDISVSGAKFMTPAGETPTPVGGSLDLILNRDRQSLELSEVRVVRSDNGEVAVTFLNLPRSDRRNLEKILADLPPINRETP